MTKDLCFTSIKRFSIKMFSGHNRQYEISHQPIWQTHHVKLLNGISYQWTNFPTVHFLCNRN